ncbi:hypothetical protein E8E11_009212 [Didymella keratinophila]|nr:hypothetical protein E8E11_009212 [Didymella keratinophila]
MPLLETRIRNLPRCHDWSRVYFIDHFAPPVDMLSSTHREYKYEFQPPRRQYHDRVLRTMINIMRVHCKRGMLFAASNVRIFNMDLSPPLTPSRPGMSKRYAFQQSGEEVPFAVEVKVPEGSRLLSENRILIHYKDKPRHQHQQFWMTFREFDPTPISFNSRPFARNASKTFRPAFDYLSNNLRAVQLPSTSKQTSKYSSSAHRRKTTNDSIDDTDSDLESNNYSSKRKTMDRRSHSRHGSQEAGASLTAPVPLIDIGSRSASPHQQSHSYPRSRSAAQSEDEDDDYDYDYEGSSSIRPLVGGGRSGYERTGGSWKMVLRQGGLGKWLLGTWVGWQVWVGLLVFWTGGCGFGLLLMNRFIMLTGVYKFPFPLTGTYVQLVLTHVLLIGFSSLTRGLASPLRRLGLGAVVAPAIPVAPQGGAFRNASTKSGAARFLRWLSNGSGGIAGGGLFEFDYSIAKQVLPLAIVFVAKVLLSNFSFAYAPLPVYQLARIGVTPLSLLFSYVLQKDSISAPTLSAALIATLNLLFATLRSNVRVTWESIVAGVFSSVFAALYPILLLRTYRTLHSSLAPQSDVLAGYPTRSAEDDNREETRAYYRTLHYTSLLSIALLTPIVLLSGEPRNILHNIPFLDVPFFWLMIWCGAIGSWAVFSSTLVLVKATSPLTATFINVPRSGVQLMLLSMFKMPAHSWVGRVQEEGEA